MRLATVQAIVVELSDITTSERGCLVIGPDGKLYELILPIMPSLSDVGGMDQAEETRELVLEPSEYVLCAYRAIQKLARLYEEHPSFF